MLRRKIKLGMTLILLIGVIILSRKLSLIVTNEILETQAKVILIDPGHGGADPGKVGINGALEKDIIKLNEIFAFNQQGLTKD